VLIEDDIDDEPVLPEDTLASDKEIAEAVAQARESQGVQARLLLAAKFILAKTKELKRTCEPEDLLQEAILSVLLGKRKWRTNRVDFKGLLVGVMRSMASNRGKALTKTSALNLSLEHELPLVGEEQLPHNLEETSADPETTEEKLIRSEQEVFEKSQMAILLAKYEAGSIYRQILDMIRDGFVSHLGVREALGIEESVYRNAWKVLMRAAESLNTCTKEN